MRPARHTLLPRRQRPLSGTLRRALGVLVAVIAVLPAAWLGAAASGAAVPHLLPRLTDDVVRVEGNRLVDGAGHTIVLRGVDRSGMEYACVQGWGMADGPMDQASVNEMAAWHIDAVRLPLNEDCWLGINGVASAYSGARYRTAVAAYLRELRRDGIVAVLDLHWNAPDGTPATGQQDMADADHSTAFWASVAGTFRLDHDIIFDLYNEPHGISWRCWRSGCDTPGYRTAGMQTLVDAVRSAGATQPVMLGALGWSSATGGPDEYGSDPRSGWLRWRPFDPAHQEILSVHLYQGNGCDTVSCWDRTVAPIARGVPVVVGEFGESDCATGFDTSLMDWDDAHGISYLAWAWNATTQSCGGSGPSVITGYDGRPTLPGRAVEDHYRAYAPGAPAAH